VPHDTVHQCSKWLTVTA